MCDYIWCESNWTMLQSRLLFLYETMSALAQLHTNHQRFKLTVGPVGPTLTWSRISSGHRLAHSFHWMVCWLLTRISLESIAVWAAQFDVIALTAEFWHTRLHIIVCSTRSIAGTAVPSSASPPPPACECDPHWPDPLVPATIDPQRQCKPAHTQRATCHRRRSSVTASLWASKAWASRFDSASELSSWTACSHHIADIIQTPCFNTLYNPSISKYVGSTAHGEYVFA